MLFTVLIGLILVYPSNAIYFVLFTDNIGKTVVDGKIQEVLNIQARLCSFYWLYVLGHYSNIAEVLHNRLRDRDKNLPQVLHLNMVMFQVYHAILLIGYRGECCSST